MIKHIWALLFTSALFLISTSVAALSDENPLTKPDLSCSCKSLADEELESPRKFNFGAFSGQCIDACRFRKSDLLSSDSNTSLVFSNFMHDGQFWKVKLWPDRVSQARIGFEEFMPGIFHVFLVFDFEKGEPLVLESQLKEQKPKSTKVTSLVFSPEGIPAQGKKYNFFDAYLNRYVVGFRLLSAEQVMQYSVVKLKHTITTYALKLNKNQLNSLLAESLKMTEQKSFVHQYRLFSNNCATNILDLIEKVEPKIFADDFMLLRAINAVERSLPISGPVGLVKLLAKKGLISNASAREIKPEPNLVL